jgi:hypothetical protein
MKLFNAQSANKQVKSTKTGAAVNTVLDTKVMVNKDLLIAVAGGLNDTVAIWPPVKPK